MSGRHLPAVQTSPTPVISPTDLSSTPATVAGMTTTAALAQALGKTSARAGRDWCQRHSIPYRRDGKHNWVSVADVKRVLAGLPVRGGPAAERADAATAAVAALTKKR